MIPIKGKHGKMRKLLVVLLIHYLLITIKYALVTLA